MVEGEEPFNPLLQKIARSTAGKLFVSFYLKTHNQIVLKCAENGFFGVK
jgi:hypothetical protein